MKLALALFFCHFLADFTPLSTPYMLNAKRFGRPLYPIFLHALTHAFLMGIAILIGTLNPDLAIQMGLFQLATHFLIDFWKGRMNETFVSCQNPANKQHWMLFGFDQFLHAVVILAMITLIYR